ncbi:MAG: hypothetical protein GY737_00075 [Desulfobacteraceae bacterium]|nr:hypothetical protein [Desulfobacteraceae bacterium]
MENDIPSEEELIRKMMLSHLSLTTTDDEHTLLMQGFAFERGLKAAAHGHKDMRNPFFKRLDEIREEMGNG